MRYTNIIDFSQWANGEDFNLYGLEKLKKNAIEISKRCSKYIFISTMSINIDLSAGYKHSNYTENKLYLEKSILSYGNQSS